jgi:hypothetical protein
VTVHRAAGPTPEKRDVLDFTGDARLLLTAPFFPNVDPLQGRTPGRAPDDGIIDVLNRLVQSSRSTDPFLKGSLTYDTPRIDVVTQFSGAADFEEELVKALDLPEELQADLTVTGILFPDGYGSVAVRIDVAEGWIGENRSHVMSVFGPDGRDRVTSELRALLLPALGEVSRRCGTSVETGILFPYFNLTYGAATSLPEVGRATLPDEFRSLIYPRSSDPIGSDSPWLDEFFFAGYAFNLLVGVRPERTLDQLEFLLLHLDVLYARMARSAGFADQSIRNNSQTADITWLVDLDQRLRADYQALIGPTFSFDFHVLKLRDALLDVWGAEQIRERTETLMQMTRTTVGRRLAEDQARRVSRVNLIVVILTVLSVVASVDAAVNLWTRFH